MMKVYVGYVRLLNVPRSHPPPPNHEVEDQDIDPPHENQLADHDLNLPIGIV